MLSFQLDRCGKDALSHSLNKEWVQGDCKLLKGCDPDSPVLGSTALSLLPSRANGPDTVK